MSMQNFSMGGGSSTQRKTEQQANVELNQNNEESKESALLAKEEELKALEAKLKAWEEELTAREKALKSEEKASGHEEKAQSADRTRTVVRSGEGELARFTCVLPTPAEKLNRLQSIRPFVVND